MKTSLDAALALAMLIPCFSANAETMDAKGHGEKHHGPHHLSVLSAGTHVRGHGDYTTLGIDYEYRISPSFGLGVVLERAFDGLDATTALAVTNFHLNDRWVMQLGSGYEHSHGDNIFAARVGVLYSFEFEGFTLAPQLHWNYLDAHDNAVVAGIALGFSF